jgi:hypothetical protein
MSRADDRLADLLAESLRLWRVPARVTRPADGVLLIESLGAGVRIGRAEPGLPFRWTVAVIEAGAKVRERPALSVIAVLRQVRQALDPGYARLRLRVVAPPVLPPERGP